MYYYCTIKNIETQISTATLIQLTSDENQSDIENLLQSMQDGFGQVPKEITNLCKLAFLRNLAGNFSVEKIKINNNVCEVVVKKQENVIDKAIAKNLSAYNGKLSFDNNVKIIFGFVGTVQSKLEKLIEFFLSCNKND